MGHPVAYCFTTTWMREGHFFAAEVHEDSRKEDKPQEQQPHEGQQPQAGASSGEAGGSRAQVPVAILPDLIRFLDEHEELDTVAKAKKVAPQ